MQRKILAVSFAFPPLSAPRSIQVARLLRHLDAAVTVLCGADPAERQDATIAPDIDRSVEHVIREPFVRSGLLRQLELVADRCHLSWARLPDVYRPWVARADARVMAWQQSSGYRPDLLLTFGQPMSDHLFGLTYQRRTGIPWVAHFSDPWADNPFRRDNPLTARWNRRLERQVIAAADAVLFTSPETLDLVMRKYPATWRDKAFYVPHCYDPAHYDRSLRPPDGLYILRYVGNFYGHRSPRPLFEAVEVIARDTPGLLAGVTFEFAGAAGRFARLADRYPLARRHLRFLGPVSYTGSLRLMQTAHCLLVIDAPDELSVFFPSKLVEYIGANRYIFALTPPGASARIVQELGGLVANPSDAGAVTTALRQILTGRPTAFPLPPHRYSQEAVAGEVMRILQQILDSRRVCHA